MLELSAPVIAIVGPTASGKTDAAQIVAERLGGEVVSADSMQIYRGMDIGTGKLPAWTIVPERYQVRASSMVTGTMRPTKDAASAPAGTGA